MRRGKASEVQLTRILLHKSYDEETRWMIMLKDTMKEIQVQSNGEVVQVIRILQC
jgi:hypothetical protein